MKYVALFLWWVHILNCQTLYILHATSDFSFCNCQSYIYILSSIILLFMLPFMWFTFITHYYSFSLCHILLKLLSPSDIPKFEIMPIDFLMWVYSLVCLVTAASLYFILFENYPLNLKWNYSMESLNRINRPAIMYMQCREIIYPLCNLFPLLSLFNIPTREETNRIPLVKFSYNHSKQTVPQGLRLKQWAYETLMRCNSKLCMQMWYVNSKALKTFKNSIICLCLCVRVLNIYSMVTYLTLFAFSFQLPLLSFLPFSIWSLLKSQIQSEVGMVHVLRALLTALIFSLLLFLFVFCAQKYRLFVFLLN